MGKATSGANSRDRALDELYGASPAEFTGKRDAITKALKAAGDVAGANEIKAQRKPTQIAYVLNQLARKHADDLADLVDVGRELARAQRKALRGEAGSDLRDAIAWQRSVVAGLTAKTATLMGELGVAATGHLDEIASALQAALVDPAVGAKLEEGRLDKVPAPAAGFPGAAPQEVEEQEPRPRHAKADVKADVKADAKADAKARREATERAAREAAASSAASEAAERARIADAAERDADGLAAQAKKLDDAASALAAEAKRLSAEAKRVAREAEIARGHAERAATAAARAAKLATTSRSDADRAANHARTTASRV